MRRIIDTDQAFRDLCKHLDTVESIAVDTEFMRRDTYYAKLSIIQVSDGQEAFVIDALAVVLDDFKDILINPNILKIFHSPLQDFQIFYKLFKILPVNVFDSQVAASFCGFGPSISYADLCLEICDVVIDKTYQAANWMERPLSHAMMEYATCDVEHLHQIYNNLYPKVANLETYKSTLHDKLLDVELYKLNLESAWKRIKYRDHSMIFVMALQELAAFREECASSLDIPRGHVISDKDLLTICRTLPTGNKELKGISTHKLTQSQKNKIFDLCMGLRLSKPIARRPLPQ